MKDRDLAARRGFSLIEMLIVVVIVGLIASVAVPAYADTQRLAYNAVALADLNGAMHAIEAYMADHHALPSEEKLKASGFALSQGVSLLEYSIRQKSNPQSTRVHMHIAHRGSPQYYHVEYPGGAPPRLEWKIK